jgi:hypothetical protein
VAWRGFQTGEDSNSKIVPSRSKVFCVLTYTRGPPRPNPVANRCPILLLLSTGERIPTPRVNPPSRVTGVTFLKDSSSICQLSSDNCPHSHRPDGKASSHADFAHEAFVSDDHQNPVDLTGARPKAEEDANGDSGSPRLSGDGRFVAFASLATNLGAGEGESNAGVFIHDRLNGTTTLMSTSSERKLADSNY